MAVQKIITIIKKKFDLKPKGKLRNIIEEVENEDLKTIKEIR